MSKPSLFAAPCTYAEPEETSTDDEISAYLEHAEACQYHRVVELVENEAMERIMDDWARKCGFQRRPRSYGSVSN